MPHSQVLAIAGSLPERTGMDRAKARSTTAIRWRAVMSGTPGISPLLLESRWSQNRTGFPLWRSIAAPSAIRAGGNPLAALASQQA